MERAAILLIAVGLTACGDQKTEQKTTTYEPIRAAKKPIDAAVLAATETGPERFVDGLTLQSCQLGDDPACATARAAAEGWLGEISAEDRFALGHIYYKGAGGGQDTLAARDHYDKACSGGYAIGCTMLGVLHEKGEAGGAANTKTAATYYGRACDAGDAKGCFRHGLGFETGTAGTTDMDKARALYRKSCDSTVPEGCNNLAVLIRDGKGGSAEPEAARALFKQSCDADYALSCLNLGVMIANGVGGPAEVDAAKALIGKACSLGNADACAIAGPDAGPPN